MANYQPPHNFPLHHPSDNNLRAPSEGASHPPHPIQGAMKNAPAHPRPTLTPVANEADEDAGSHTRINLDPIHTCAACKVTFRNNYTLEQHASKERHQAFLCTCGTDFGRLGSLNRHITAQAGPRYYCDYCDDRKCFARLDKIVDHLQGSHKFGKNAIAQFRSNARAKSKGPTSSTVPATSAGQPVSTSAGYDAGSGVVSVGQMANSAGISAGPSAGFDSGMNDFPMSSAAEHQPLAPVEDYSWLGAGDNFAGFDFSGLDFSDNNFLDLDGDMDLSGMDNRL